MGLVYNHKNKLDLVVLSEEKLENPEGEIFDFVIEPVDTESAESDSAADGGCEHADGE